MAHIINPAGRMVAIDDQELYEKYRNMEGFKIPTKEEEDRYIRERQFFVESLKKETPQNVEESEVLFATVSQGGADGYGVSSKWIIDELKRAGTKVSLKPSSQQKVGILYHNPYSILTLETPFRIIFTMFESTKIPEDWKDYLEAADLVIVPSQWCKEVFKKSGVDTTVVPLGYNPKVFNFQSRENKREVRKDFVFLHYNAFNLRKGFIEVFKAFNKAFQPDEPVKIILKTTLKQPPLPIVPSQYPNIIVETGEYSDHEMIELMKRSDCFVYPSRGEGFGMTPLEAMATGMPTIVPNAHGITEYFNKDFMYEVKVEEMCPGIYSRYKGQDVGEMYVSSIDDLAQQMRYVYEHQDEALQKGINASEYVKQWTYDKTADKLKSIIDRYLGMEPSSRPVKNILNLEEV